MKKGEIADVFITAFRIAHGCRFGFSTVVHRMGRFTMVTDYCVGPIQLRSDTVVLTRDDPTFRSMSRETKLPVDKQEPVKCTRIISDVDTTGG